MIDQVDSRRGTICTSQSSAVEALMPIDEFFRKAQTHCQWQPSVGESVRWAELCWPFTRVLTRGSHVPGINRQDRRT